MTESNLRTDFVYRKKIQTDNCDPLFVFKTNKRELTFDKPINLGIKNLESSKLHLYEFYYLILQNFWDEGNLGLRYMETDIFYYSCIPETG